MHHGVLTIIYWTHGREHPRMDQEAVSYYVQSDVNDMKYDSLETIQNFPQVP